MNSPSEPSGENPVSIHRPVMLREVLQQLNLHGDESVVDGTIVDGTVGGGGHSQEILKQLSPNGRLIGLDRDPMMLSFASQKLNDPRVSLHHSSYANLPDILAEFEQTHVDRILVDLGLSSDQLEDRNRGFSFHAEGPLDLRFDVSSGVPVSEWLASQSADEIEHILAEYSDEPLARAVAQAITESNKRGRHLSSAKDLGDLVEQIYRKHPAVKTSSHPATRTFQALRIVVNEELQQLQTLLDDVAPACLSPGGRIVVITFHSLEDRMVKQAFRESRFWCEVPKKPVLPRPTETRLNPRSRSAKLRMATRK